MSYDIYRYIFIGGLVLTGVFLLTTVAIFFLLNIKNVIGDLTGSNAKKGIENIRNQGVKAPKNKKEENNHTQQNQSITGGMIKTSKISPQDRFDTLAASETSILKDMPQQSAEVLQNTVIKHNPINPNFIIEADITFVHSSEVIK